MEEPNLLTEEKEQILNDLDNLIRFIKNLEQKVKDL